jgi:hypothetical protein
MLVGFCWIMVAGLNWESGSGWFAAPFGIRCGIDPSRELALIAKRRGGEGVRGKKYIPLCWITNYPKRWCE